MKLFLTLLILCPLCHCKVNVIDKLVTINDVTAFLKSKAYNDSADYFEALKHDSTSKLSKVRFIKIDLNRDGLTDLIVDGKYLFTAIDIGNGNFQFDVINGGTAMLKQYSLIDIGTVTSKQPIIIVKPYGRLSLRNTTPPGVDSLTLKDNNFIEYNAQHALREISSISMTTSPCFGTCPIFTIAIKRNGEAIYDAGDYNKKKGNLIRSLTAIP